MDNVKYWLEEFDALSVHGKDSKRFLNGLTTSNINLENEVISIVDREEGGENNLLENNIKLKSLFKISDFVN